MHASSQSEIGLVLYPGAQLASIYGLTDLFAVANGCAGGATPPLRVTHWQATDDGVVAIWDSRPGYPARPSYIIVPLTLSIMPDAPLMGQLSRWLAARHAEGVTLGSVCSGIFVLAETGLLAGRAVSTHWSCTETLAGQFPDIRIAAEDTLIDGGDIITAGGFLSWLDIGLRLVDRILGPAVAHETARFLSAERHVAERPHLNGFVPPLDHGDAAILKAQRWIHKRDGREVSLALLAREAGLEKRTFLRRFATATGRTPLEYCRLLRVAKAKEWLESSNRTVGDIAWAVGYADAKALNRVFRRITGTSPAEHRRQSGTGRQAGPMRP